MKWLLERMKYEIKEAEGSYTVEERIIEKIDTDQFAEFLELPEDKIFEMLTGVKLHWIQRIYIKSMCRWWNSMRKLNSHLRGIVLWESIYKGRF